MHPTKSINILPRADTSSSSSLSASSSNPCAGSDSGECQKPVTNNATVIAVSIVVPLVVIFIVLGFFLWRNYRKDKKEMLEHDPDFDETGDVTALPDFAPSIPMSKDLENPFHNRNSIAPNRLTTLQSNSGISLSNINPDPYIVLPYTHQTGSKVSLDEYSRQLGDNLGYQRGSTYRQNASSITDASSVAQRSALKYQQGSSPVKYQQGSSPIKYQQGSPTKYQQGSSPTKSHQGKQYSNIPNLSQSSLGDSSGSLDTEKYEQYEKYATKEVPESDESAENRLNADTTVESKINAPSFTFNDDSSNGEFTFSDDNIQPETRDYAQEKTVDHSTTDNGDLSEVPIADPQFTSTANHEEREVEKEVEKEEDAEESQENDEKPLPRTNINMLKSPRISQFNLLNNDSDDEEHTLTKEQEEEIKRMKSVYKVYFDKDKVNPDGKYVSDPNEQLPEIQVEDTVRVNKDLKADTDYNRRMTTTSSIYTQNNFAGNNQAYYDANQQGQYYDANQQGQYYDANQQGQYYNANQQGQAYYNQGQHYNEPNQQGYYDQHGNFYPAPQDSYPQARGPQQDLPPLRALGSASDIRKSTIQTYTDFQPSKKGGQMSSPTMRVPFNPIENQGIWNSPSNSPIVEAESTFNQSVQNQPTTGAAPSASQLARTSVVMLNPVTEITKQRTFKPAGSLPLQNMGTYHNQQYLDLNASENDLIPGNRKSAVRRMMNTNF